MKAAEIIIKDFFKDDKFFIIPVYQRKYDWQKENCEQLLNDIENIILTNKTHFLGTFVYQKKANADDLTEYVIIDGQQRITSMILLAKVLMEKISDEGLKQDISEMFIKNISRKIKNQLKLKPTEYDLKIFDKLMKFDELHFDNAEKNSVMYQNYLFFRENISNSDEAEKIFNAISKLKVVGILLENENPQEIFESLNSTGRELKESDLVRNYLLMPLDYSEQEELYKTYWLQIERIFPTSNEVENFMVQYLITKRKSVDVNQNGRGSKLSIKNLYPQFKKYRENKNDDVEKFLSDFYRYARFYKHFIFDENTNFDSLDELDKKFYELIYLIGAKESPIILMYLYDKYEQKIFDKETFIKFVDAMISLSFRAKICRCKGIDSQFAGNVILRLDNADNLTEEIFWNEITFGKGNYAFPNDETFKESLIHSDIYSKLKNHCKYLLYSLERYSEHSKELPKYSDATIEHIMPQKLNTQWEKYLDEKNDLQTSQILLHTLGNLTLTNYNSKLSNSDFVAKKKEYADSNYFYTKQLKNYTDWTSRQILSRAKKLSNEALKIWILPEKYNGAVLNLFGACTLDSDFEVFTGKKPDKLFISEKEFPVSTWRNLFLELLKNFYSLDTENFKQAIQFGRNNIFSDDKTKLRDALQIDENFFAEGNRSAKELLKTLKIFVENFDSLNGTNFKDEIFFTLKN